MRERRNWDIFQLKGSWHLCTRLASRAPDEMVREELSLAASHILDALIFMGAKVDQERRLPYKSTKPWRPPNPEDGLYGSEAKATLYEEGQIT